MQSEVVSHVLPLEPFLPVWKGIDDLIKAVEMHYVQDQLLLLLTQ